MQLMVTETAYVLTRYQSVLRFDTLESNRSSLSLSHKQRLVVTSDS
jgi:hypothetical protein